MIRNILTHILMIAGLATLSLAADHYVCQAASGSGDGSSWTNACNDFAVSCDPSGMVRGDTYWVAGGSYAASGVTFNAADNGTSIITIKAATDSNHGGTSTGWTNGGTGACHQGQATFRALVEFTTDYWVFDGSYRGSDWRSGYGFMVNNDNGGTPYNSIAGILAGSTQLWSLTISDIVLRYVEVSGSHDKTATYSDRGIRINSATGGTSNNDYIGYTWSHDVGTSWFTLDSVSNFTLEYSWGQNNQSGATHGEGVQIECSGGTGSNPTGVDANLILRYNYFENSEGTGYIATPCSTDILPSNWYIYGNIFFGNSAEGNGRGYGDGNGAIALWNFNHWVGDLIVYNNTFSLLSQQGGAGQCDVELMGTQGSNPQMDNVQIQNNLYYGCSQGVSRTTCPSGTSCPTFNYSYNAYFETPTNDTPGSPDFAQIVTSTNPFVHVSQTVGADNFQLNADTAAWNPLPSPYNMDMNGLTRSSSRGALQFSQSSGAPNPPTGLTATVK